jgi:hypothetical protein
VNQPAIPFPARTRVAAITCDVRGEG